MKIQLFNNVIFYILQKNIKDAKAVTQTERSFGTPPCRLPRRNPSLPPVCRKIVVPYPVPQ
jgi:hypothetical protein